MPTVEANKKDLEKLIGKKLSMSELKEAVLFAKGEVDAVEGNNVKIDVKDANRPDLWSAEGIARVIKSQLVKSTGIPKYKTKQSGVKVFVEKSVQKSRPFIACAVARNVKVTDDFLVQIIQLQEKVSESFGRKRRECAIGLYDLDKLKPPIYYRGYKPKSLEFVPLEFKSRMRLDEILETHPKGIAYKHLLKGMERYPIVIDSADVVASMPPIINSETTGKITGKTKNLFLEVTGFRQDYINIALNVMVAALADRGAKIETVEIRSPAGKKSATPNFTPKKIKLNLDYVNRISGLMLSKAQVVKLLGKACYDVKAKGNVFEIAYPAYRGDILHPVDVVEDIIIAYDYSRIKPAEVKVPTKGCESNGAIDADIVRNVCVGLGMQEILTFTLTSRENQEEKMGLKDLKLIEIANPVSLNWCVFRKSIVPELLAFLARNKHAAYPQRIFEIGKTVHLDPKSDTGVSERNVLCAALTHGGTNFTEIKSALDAVCRNMGWNYTLVKAEHQSFAAGKSGSIKAGNKGGAVGELNKKVLRNFNLDLPVSVFEIEF